MFLLNNGIKIIKHIEVADSFYKRTKGLLGEKKIEDDYGMFFPSCNFIHTFFMLFDIDVVMVDKKLKVVYTKQKMKPFGAAFYFEAAHTFEFATGIIRKKKIKKGDLLELECGD